MVDRKEGPPGSITQAADAQNERISGISNVSKTVNAMRDKAMRDMQNIEKEIDQNKDVRAIESSMNRVLKRLGETINTLNKGVQNITIGTAKATKDAISQYGKALGEDLGFQKKNFIAMTLARTTPLFGYFAAKFMETDVFKNAAQKMRENISKTIGGVWAGTKGLARKITGRKEPGEDISLGKTAAREIPKMQKGGYVEKGGLVRVHSGEVVAPIEKVLSRVDESISTAKDLAAIARKTQMSMVADMKTYVAGERKKAPKGIIRGFVSAYADVQKRYMEPTDKRMLRALLAIQQAIGAQPETLSQVWTEFISQHPWFRTMLMSFRGLGSVFSATFVKPLKFMFGLRGGYHSDLSKDHNPLRSMAENIGNVYVGTMWRLDNIAMFTRRTAEAIMDVSTFFTGRKYPRLEGVEEPGWTIMGLVTKGIGKLFSRVIFRPIEGILGGILMMAAASEGKEAQGRAILRRYSNIKALVGGFVRKVRESKIPILGRGPLHGGFLTHGFRAGMYEDVYGRAGGAGGAFGARRMRGAMRVMPKLIKDQSQFYRDGKKVMSFMVKRLPEERKESRKLITMTAGVQDELQRHNKRERRKAIWKLLGTLGGGIWGMVKTAGRMFWDVAKGFLTDPKTLALIGSALAGAGLGLAINKWVIRPAIDRVHDMIFRRKQYLATRSKEKLAEKHREIGAIDKRIAEGTASKEDIATKKAYWGSQAIAMRESDKMAGMLKSKWGWGAENVMNYMNLERQKYSAVYTDFTPQELSKIRSDWYTRGFKKAELWKIKDPKQYAAAAEKQFFDFLIEHPIAKKKGAGGAGYIPMTGGPGITEKIRREAARRLGVKSVDVNASLLAQKLGMKPEAADQIQRSIERGTLLEDYGVTAKKEELKMRMAALKKQGKEEYIPALQQQLNTINTNVSNMANSTVNAAKEMAGQEGVFGKILSAGDHYFEKMISADVF